MNYILQYKDYSATVPFSNKDDVFYGKAIDINELITFEGALVKKFKKAFRAAIDDYLLPCKELSKTPDKTYKGSFDVQSSSEFYK
jgi:predicted HicB family RNase H-like nuclease